MNPSRDAHPSKRRNPNGLEFTDDDLVDMYDGSSVRPGSSPQGPEWFMEALNEADSAGQDHGHHGQQQREVDKVDSKRGVIDAMLTRLGGFWETARDYINAFGSHPMAGTKGV